jgi:RND family efflux transporter MFP subunit
MIKNNKIKILIIIVLMIVAYLLYYFFIHQKNNNDQKQSLPVVIVKKPQRMLLAEYITQTGNTVAYQSVDLVARVKGYLDAIKFTDGSFVKKGQPLFVIEPEPYFEQLTEAKATLASKKASLAYAETEYARQQRMYQQNATSLNNVQKWRARRDEAQANLLQAKANVVTASINYSYTSVSAPFTGRIGRHLVDEGNLVGDGNATTLATIEKINPIYVYFNLNELDFIKLRNAARKYGLSPQDINKVPVFVAMQNEKNFPHQGKLDFIDTSLSTSTGTMELRAILANEDYTLLPGLFVQVRIPLSEPTPHLMVPAAAVQYDQIGAYLFVVDKTNTVVLKRVELGASNNGMTAVTKGLSQNELIIVDGLQNATQGKQVSPQMQTLKDAK